MYIYLLEQETDVYQCSFEVDLYNRDFIIALNVTSTKQSTNETFTVDFNISHQNGSIIQIHCI